MKNFNNDNKKNDTVITKDAIYCISDIKKSDIKVMVNRIYNLIFTQYNEKKI